MKLILDTHLIAEAVRASAKQSVASKTVEKSADTATELLRAIIRICSVIVFTRPHKKEVLGVFGRTGLRFPGQSPFFKELEDKRKIFRPGKSRIPALKPAQLKHLRGTGHEGVTDDRHLVEAALAEKACIITRDPWLLKKRALFRREFHIEVFSPDQVKTD